MGRKSQIFRENVPKELLFGFLTRTCKVDSGYYVFNKVSFKRAQFKNLVGDFVRVVTPYYFSSKKYYVEREITYRNLMTIIRQICKSHNIFIDSKEEYSNSYCDMSYRISVLS